MRIGSGWDRFVERGMMRRISCLATVAGRYATRRFGMGLILSGIGGYWVFLFYNLVMKCPTEEGEMATGIFAA